jgi:hypothetical protein
MSEETQLELAAASTEAGEILDLVKRFEITDQPAMDLADEALAEVKAKLKWLEKKRKAATGPMLEALEEIRSWFRPAETYYKEAEGVWKSKMSAFRQVQEVAQRKALQAVQAAHQAGDVTEVAAAMTRAVAADVVLPSSVSIRKRWVAVVYNWDKLPAEYWTRVPDLDKIQTAVELSEGQIEIPGVRVDRKDIVIQRAK